MWYNGLSVQYGGGVAWSAEVQCRPGERLVRGGVASAHARKRRFDSGPPCVFNERKIMNTGDFEEMLESIERVAGMLVKRSKSIDAEFQNIKDELSEVEERLARIEGKVL